MDRSINGQDAQSDHEDALSIPAVSPEENQRQWASVLNQREEFYRSILDSLAEGVVITNSESRILYANQAMEQITGYNREELRGRVSYEILAPPQNWGVMQRRLKERLSGKSENYEHELIRKDGSVSWVAVKATPYRNAVGEIVGTVGAISCIDRQKSLERENEYLLDEIRQERNAGNIVGRSPALQKVLDQIKMVAPTCANVLILGESGTGKELVAQAIHEQSDRRNKPLVRVNCASIPKDLFESEFFGHVRGAFTGAIKDRVGRFELANGGSLFLDEVGEIPLDLQSKLLRVLQEGQFERLGDDRTRTVSVRIIAATNRDLLAEAKAGRFRMDLYYRLSVFPVELPPLRERREDIAPLAMHFLQQAVQRAGIGFLQFSQEQIRQLESYDWPGNVRELQNVVERAVIISRGRELQLEFRSSRISPSEYSSGSWAPSEMADAVVQSPQSLSTIKLLKQQERSMIEQALKKTNGKIYGSDGAAALLGLKPTTLASKIHRMGIGKAQLE